MNVEIIVKIVFSYTQYSAGYAESVAPSTDQDRYHKGLQVVLAIGITAAQIFRQHKVTIIHL